MIQYIINPRPPLTLVRSSVASQSPHPSPGMASPSLVSDVYLSGPDSACPDRNPFNPANIFNVDGLVAVVTGGGTGEYR